MAGADNCYYDAWPNGIDRQLKPFFGAAKVDFTCRDGGHNGGFPMAAQIVCAEAIAGMDADMIVQSSPFVHPDRSDPIFEDFVRRAAIEGVIVNVQSGAEKLVDAYARYGLTSGCTATSTWFGTVSHVLFRILCHPVPAQRPALVTVLIGCYDVWGVPMRIFSPTAQRAIRLRLVPLSREEQLGPHRRRIVPR